MLQFADGLHHKLISRRGAPGTRLTANIAQGVVNKIRMLRRFCFGSSRAGSQGRKIRRIAPLRMSNGICNFSSIQRPHAAETASTFVLNNPAQIFEDLKEFARPIAWNSIRVTGYCEVFQ
jgi:hypothetical protein